MSTDAVTLVVADLLSIPTPDAYAQACRETPEMQGLVAAAKAGDREAFGRLVDAHEQAVLRTALAALGRREDAEDAAQEALIIAWRKLPAFRGDSTFKTWLLTIVWRKALDRRRSRVTWWYRTGAIEDSDAQLALADDAAIDPEGQTLHRDLERRITAAISQLSPKLRDALLLAATGEHSYAEIASMLGTRLGTVKWRVSEARRLVSTTIGRTKDCEQHESRSAD